MVHRRASPCLQQISPITANRWLVWVGSCSKSRVPQIRGEAIRLLQATDGLSNTLRVMESAGRPNIYQLGKLVSAGTAPPSPYTNGGESSICRPASDIDFLPATPDGTSYPGTCAINCTNGFAYPGTTGPFGTEGSGAPYSFHTGGINAVFGDGSVHFIQQSIDVVTFASLVTLSNGEVIANSFYQ